MSRKYDLLILDYGGVYSFEYDPGSFDKIMRTVFGKQPNEAEREKIVRLSSLLGSNKITVKSYVKQVATILAAPLPKTSLFEEETVSFGFPPSPIMVELVKYIRTSGIKVSLLSDMYMFELIKTSPEGRYEGFDYTSFSAEVGYTKSSPEAFIVTLNHFGTKPDKTLFVDDVLNYTKNAKSVGIDVLWADKSKFKDPKQLVDAITEMLDLLY